MIERVRGALTSGRFHLVFHTIGLVVWLALAYPGMTTWRDAVAFVSFASIWANIGMHLTGVASSIAARKADPDDPL